MRQAIRQGRVGWQVIFRCSLAIVLFRCQNGSAPLSSESRRSWRGCHSVAHSTASKTIAEHATADWSDSWSLLVLGDLHMEDNMTAHDQARQDCLDALEELSILPSISPDENLDSVDDYSAKDVINEIESSRAGDLSVEQLELLLARKREGTMMKTSMVSLGDLGRKDIRNEPGDAGTTKSFTDAKDFLDGFNLPYDLVTGNHDLEGLDEFDTDADNLQAWLRSFDKPTPQFCRQIGAKTLLLGMSTVRFRSSPFSSHEVHIDQEQIDWFLKTVKAHPSEEGWKILVFSHAPIMGSGLRVLQNAHITNGCAWLNHCSDDTRSIFIETVKNNPQIKLWFSGHFHLSHDFVDSLSTVGYCTFVQVGVIGPVSTRDGKRQTRVVQGCRDRIKIFTVNHHERDAETGKALLRLDADLDLHASKVPSTVDPRKIEEKDWFQAYTPREKDGCYLESPNGSVADAIDSKVCWWHMQDGRVLGLHNRQLVEYDAETLSPLGIVVKGLGNEKEVVVVGNGSVLALIDKSTKEIEVIHPKEDGSYWRRFQRNKKNRQEEKAREAIAKMWLDQKEH